MATTITKFCIVTVIQWLLILLPFINVCAGRPVDQQNEGNICYFYSAIWKGPAFIAKHCDIQCKEKEAAMGGEIHKFACVCKYNCEDFCESLSGTWKGLCLDDSLCSKECRAKQASFRGECPDGRCWCVNYCKS